MTAITSRFFRALPALLLVTGAAVLLPTVGRKRAAA
jgi:hypothetical protein